MTETMVKQFDSGYAPCYIPCAAESKISPKELWRTLQEHKPANVTVLDFRAPSAYEAAHIPGSINIPFRNPDMLPNLEALLRAYYTTGIFVFCAYDDKLLDSAEFCHLLARHKGPFKILEGGWAAWVKENLPVAYTATNLSSVNSTNKASYERQPERSDC